MATAIDGKKNSGGLLFMGVVMVILGLIGLSMEVALTLTTLIFFGFLVLFAGVAQLVHVFQGQGLKSKLWDLLIALVYIASGIAVIVHPAATAVWFTLFIASALVVAGIFRILLGFQMRANDVNAWGWIVFGGIISIVLGSMIFSAWPISGLWVIGMFIAIELLLQGFTLISIALAAKAIKL